MRRHETEGGGRGQGGGGGGTYLIVLEISRERVILALRTIDAEPLRQVAEEQLAYLSSTQRTLLRALGHYLREKERPCEMTIAECYGVYLCHIEEREIKRASRARVFDEIRRLGSDFHFLDITRPGESLAPEDAVITILHDLDEVSWAIDRLERAAALQRCEEERDQEERDGVAAVQGTHGQMSSMDLRIHLEDAWHEISETIDSSMDIMSEQEKEELKNDAALALQAAQTGDERRFAHALALPVFQQETWTIDVMKSILSEVKEAAFPHWGDR
jgi:hypothetical protein